VSSGGMNLTYCSIPMQANRVIHGWPEAWRPTTIYGPYGTNDLVNQRLVGELELDGFEVSHTKDSIQWRGDAEEQVEKMLKDESGKLPHDSIKDTPWTRLARPGGGGHQNRRG
jgi:hypothetical protein